MLSFFLNCATNSPSSFSLPSTGLENAQKSCDQGGQVFLRRNLSD